MNTATPVLPIDPDSPPSGVTASAVAALMFLWGLATLVCMTMVSMPDALGASHQVSFPRAVFTAVNAGTASGFTQQFANSEDFSTLARMALAVQTAVGIAISLFAGSLVLRRVLNFPIRIGHLLLGFIALLLIGVIGGLVGSAYGSPLDRALAGITALGGAGPSQHAVGWSTKTAELIAAPLALLGSIGVLGVLAIAHIGASAKAVWDSHISKVLLVAAVVYMGGLLLNVAELGPVDGRWLSATHTTLAARGWGLPMDFASAWPRGWVFTSIAIALLGAGSLGAMPTLGFAWLATLPRRIWPGILALLAVQGGVLLLAILGLLHTEPQLSPDRILLLAVSAAGKMGLSHEAVSIDGPGLLILAGLMAVSKFLPLGLLLTADPKEIQ